MQTHTSRLKIMSSFMDNMDAKWVVYERVYVFLYRRYNVVLTKLL